MVLRLFMSGTSPTAALVVTSRFRRLYEADGSNRVGCRSESAVGLPAMPAARSVGTNLCIWAACMGEVMAAREMGSMGACCLLLLTAQSAAPHKPMIRPTNATLFQRCKRLLTCKSVYSMARCQRNNTL